MTPAVEFIRQHRFRLEVGEDRKTSLYCRDVKVLSQPGWFTKGRILVNFYMTPEVLQLIKTFPKNKKAFIEFINGQGETISSINFSGVNLIRDGIDKIIMSYHDIDVNIIPVELSYKKYEIK